MKLRHCNMFMCNADFIQALELMLMEGTRFTVTNHCMGGCGSMLPLNTFSEIDLVESHVGAADSASIYFFMKYSNKVNSA